MTIFWERCIVCGKHRPVTECVINGRRATVCYHCSTLLTERLGCPDYWKLGNIVQKPRRQLKEIEELLKLLE